MDVIPMRSNEATLPASPLRVSADKPNFAGLDALRCFAALGVVLLHSCVPYLRNPMPGLTWSVMDTPNTAIDFLFWSIELFIMPLFLVLAGFFAWQTLQRRGPNILIRGRARRLLIPLLFGAIVILPLDLYCWVGSWVAEGIVSPAKLKSLKLDHPIGQNLWGLSHLWFLQYLFLYVACLATFAIAAKRYPWIKEYQPSLKTSLSLTVMAATLILCIEPQVVWGFQHSFLPVPSKWLYSGIFFTLGLMLAIHDPKLLWVKSYAPRLAAPALITCMLALLLGRWQLEQWVSAPTETRQSAFSLAGILLAALTAGSALLTTLSLIGLSLKLIPTVPNSVRYLAAASFWIYIVHHPILGLTHLDLKLLLPQFSPIVKMTLSFATACCLSLLTYEAVVRTTRLGQLLGFQWKPATDDREMKQEQPILSISSAESPQPIAQPAAASRRAA
ncbi:MAG: acyltransferase [Pirellulaceae bacterium]|nr:acyltransferase [Pirellulaceae bacterium]